MHPNALAWALEKHFSYFFLSCFSVFPRARVGYEMIDSQRGATHPISNKRDWNDCFIKNNQEILLYLAEFALQQKEDNLMLAIS